MKKPRYHFFTVHYEILVHSVIPAMLLAVMVGYATYLISYNSMLEHFKRDNEWLITHFAEHAATHLHSDDFTVEDFTRQVISGHVTTEGFLIRFGDGDEPLVIGDIEPEMLDLHDAESPEGSVYRSHSWYFYAPVNAAVTLPGERIPNWVVMRTSDETLKQSRMAIMRKYVLIVFGIIALYLLLLQRLLERVLGPIRSLLYYLKDIESGPLDSLAVERGPEEIRSLAVAINRLAISVRESNLLMQSEVARATAKLQITLVELEEAMEAKDQFLANMSHELRTPLTAVMGFSRLLVDEDEEEVRREHQRVIEVSSNMLLTMIDDLLEFSKAHSGQYKLEEINFELVVALRTLQSIHQPNAKSKGLTLSFEIADDLPEYFRADSVRLAQLISNLINNAIKFTDSGFVVLALSCDPISADRLLLKGSVKDSGKGIAASKIPLLFAPFSQEDTSINRRFGGAGLGLSICKQLVEMMGGTISIESALDVGTEVSFTCEVLRGDKSKAHRRNSSVERSSETLAGLTILVAEDNPFNQTLLVKLLSLYGAKCVVANNGLEAIESTRKIPLDLVLMDIHMPIIDGITACETIVRESSSAPPIIGLTADITALEKERLFTAGAADVQLKPVDESALITSILKAVKRNSATVIEGSENLLSVAMDVDDLKRNLDLALDALEAEVDSQDKDILRNLTHDLMGLGGLYGMHQLSDLVSDYRSVYWQINRQEKLTLLNELRSYLEHHFKRDFSDN